MRKQHQRRQHRQSAGGPATTARPATPSFTPVPVRPRQDGWTPGKQIALIQAIATCGCVTEACRQVGMSKQSAYDLYNRPDAASLRQAWDAARTQAAGQLADAVLGRAIHGVATPIFFQGERIGERRRFDERLAMWLLRHLAPDRFGAWRDGQTFHREDPDGVAKILEYALRCLAQDLVADRAGDPRPQRPSVAFTRFTQPDDIERQEEEESILAKMCRRVEEETFQERLAKIARGELRPGEPDGDVA